MGEVLVGLGPSPGERSGFEGIAENNSDYFEKLYRARN
jgi:hypothetical protein